MKFTSVVRCLGTGLIHWYSLEDYECKDNFSAPSFVKNETTLKMTHHTPLKLTHYTLHIRTHPFKLSKNPDSTTRSFNK